MSEDKKQKHLKAEVQYFRETCLLFDKNHALFKLMNIAGTILKLKSCGELAKSLKLLFGKTTSQEDESAATISICRNALSKRINARMDVF